MDITAHKEAGITVHQIISERSRGLIVMPFKESLSIWVPMQNKPAKKNILLNIFKKSAIAC